MALKFDLKKGQSVFEVELETGNIKPADYKHLWKGKTKLKDKVLIERQGCIYLPALNKQHAKAMFNNVLKSSEPESKNTSDQLYCTNCNQALEPGVIKTHCDKCAK